MILLVFLCGALAFNAPEHSAAATQHTREQTLSSDAHGTGIRAAAALQQRAGADDIGEELAQGATALRTMLSPKEVESDGWARYLRYCGIFFVELAICAAIMVTIARKSEQEAAPILLEDDESSVGWWRSTGGTVLVLSSWMAAMLVMIMLNKWIQVPEGGNFPFSIFLTAYHMLLTTVVTQVLRVSARGASFMPALAGGFLGRLSSATALRLLMPAGLYAVSLAFGNHAILDLSLSFSQMLNAGKPMVVYVISLAIGLEKSSSYYMTFLIGCACAGTFMITYGEANFSAIGLCFMLTAIFADALRLVTLKVMVSIPRLDPISAMAIFAPVCFCFLLGPLVALDLPLITWERVWHARYHLVVSGMVAVFLNFVST